MPESAPSCPGCAERDGRSAALEARVRHLEAIIEELRRGQKRQAAPFSKGAPKENPERPGRKPGAKYGPKAYRKPPDEVDEVHAATLPACCPDCGGPVAFEKIAHQFQVEIPRKPVRRRFDVEVGRCRRCRRRVHGRHPLQTSDALGAAGSQLGPDAQAFMVALNKEAGLSHGKVARVMETAFGVSVSRGGSAQAMLRVAARCGPAYREILIVVRRAEEVTADETGWRVAGTLWWLWDFVTPDATAYAIRASRGHDVPEEILGADFNGTMVHDGWAPYDFFKAASHQQCLAHLLRRCAGMLETARAGAVRFPRQVKALLQRALALRDRRDRDEITPRGLAVAVGHLTGRLERLLEWTRENRANEKLAKHLDAHRDHLFTFLRIPGLPATNWKGEQAIRPAVVNRKVWGGNRTPVGARAQQALASVLRTCVQRGDDVLDFLSATLRAPPGHAPRLLPAALAP